MWLLYLSSDLSVVAKIMTQQCVQTVPSNVYVCRYICIDYLKLHLSNRNITVCIVWFLDVTYTFKKGISSFKRSFGKVL